MDHVMQGMKQWLNPKADGIGNPPPIRRKKKKQHID
ncbi:uncharacterized protein G2W53_037756 [Senna tora]|uniref:Uncharacterized protein n=1 Tax=Senna tora TaxID=362788 RepID=A0A834W1H3_9FABA|nr:uncharacterized protein G2W53_037756 [Senna tora]